MSAPWLLDMVWRDICFAHWRADAERLMRVLPAQVTLDRYDGDAWLSVVPFRMTRIHVRGLPIVPGFSDVPEINLRTYVRVGSVRGIWFFSLDAAGPLVVRAARIATGLPYFDARIWTSEDAGGIRYTSQRAARGTLPGSFEARYAIPVTERAIAPGSIEAFLHERYHFFTCRGKRLVCGEVRHRPWSIAPIPIEIAHNTLGDLIEHPLAKQPQLAYFARELPVRACAVRTTPNGL